MKHNAALQATTVLLFFFGVANLGTAVVLRGSEQPIEEKGGTNTTQTPRQVYIDFGANWANTLRLYEDIGDPVWIHRTPWEVYAFEASPFIQPYLEEFVAYLNGQCARPPLTVPPSGSSVALNTYAPRYGCPAAGIGAPNPAWDAMRSCMFRTFQQQLSQLHADPHLSDKTLIADRLSAANASPPYGTKARFVSVPAAAGAEDGMLNLGGMTPEQMIRGGALSKPVPGLPQVQVPLVNVVSWLVGHFKQQDYVIVKMDIEGAEFSIINALLDGGHACLIDVLMIECHAVMGDCGQLLARLDMHPCIKVLREGHGGYHGWDHHSTPDKYFALDPRGR